MAPGWRCGAGPAPLTRRVLTDPSPILVIAPPPGRRDPGLRGLLATTSQRGLRPRVAFSLMDRPLTPARRRGLRGDFSTVREGEALNALSRLGVRPSDVCFLGWPDAHPHRPGHPAYRATLVRLTRWAQHFKPRSLWSPWAGERHCGSPAAAVVAGDLGRRLAPRPVCMDYLVWGWTDAALAGAPATAWALDCPRTLDARRRALACHRTQTTDLIADAKTAFRIPPGLAALTERPTEVYLERA